MIVTYFFGLVALLMMVPQGNGKLPDPKVADSVDLERYAGRWYEVARFPNSFQKKCAGNVTAEYSLLADGKIRVVNRCQKKSGKYTTATGKAKVVDKTTNAKLKVSFFWPFYGDYWILDVGPDYEYAVVSDRRRKYLWILNRTPQIDEALLQQLIAKVSAQGFDTSKLVRTSNE